MKSVRRLTDWINLATPRSRLAVWAVLSLVIFVVPFDWLTNLSLFKNLGWDWAPSIGLTRAYWLIMHGEFGQAWQLNKLIYLVLAIGLPLLAYDLLRLSRRSPSGMPGPDRENRLGQRSQPD